VVGYYQDIRVTRLVFITVDELNDAEGRVARGDLFERINRCSDTSLEASLPDQLLR